MSERVAKDKKTRTIKVDHVSFWLQKDGNFPKEYEDAFSLRGKTAAIADGASDTSYSRKWAKILTQKFTRNPESWLVPEEFKGSLEKAQKIWLENIDFSNLFYFVEAKIREGACATLLGIEFKEAEGEDILTWRAVTVGDSCLFHVRNDKFLVTFPMKQPDQFTHCLPLLCSVKDSPFRKAEPVFFDAEEPCYPGDKVVLCTDALAKYILTEYAAGRDLWRELISIQTYKKWADFIQQNRHGGGLDNDDTTMIVLSITA